MKHLILNLALLVVITMDAVSQSSASANGSKATLVLKGGTIIDVDNYGHSSNDIANAVIIIENGLIKEVGYASAVKIPKGAQILDVTDQFVMPGLVDGFGTINDQGYANSYLYNGVTTIVGLPHDDRRGQLMMDASPSPRIMLLEDFKNRVGGKSSPFKNEQQIDDFIDSLALTGVNVLWLNY